MRVDTPVTLITGGSSGIGAATARRLLNDGQRVAVTGRDPGRLKRFTEETGPSSDLLTVPGNAADYDAVLTAVESTRETFGRLDNVIANAGYATYDPETGDGSSVDTGDPYEWREMVLTNVLGPALLIRAANAALKETHGRIVLVGSIAGLVHTPGNIYGAAKWAVTGLAENTRRKLTNDGIGVTLIAPGRVDTNFWEPVGGAPDGLNLTADQIADCIAWVLHQPAGVDINTVVVRPIGQAV